ncbi:MAG TPA: hypothetical protein VFG47_19750 [Geminicoccaceae bacterium]|nr:hypothetical protein [Geminicoccaceae bacterium]
MQRQPVHQVGIDRGDSGGAERGEGRGDDGQRLDPGDRPLDRSVEGLDAEAGPADAEAGEATRILPRDVPRIELDRVRHVRPETEGIGEIANRRLEAVRRQEVGRAAAPMEVGTSTGSSTPAKRLISWRIRLA